jgi:hypothetical protein
VQGLLVVRARVYRCGGVASVAPSPPRVGGGGSMASRDPRASPPPPLQRADQAPGAGDNGERAALRPGAGDDGERATPRDAGGGTCHVGGSIGGVDGVVEARGGQRRSGVPSRRLLPCFSVMEVGCTSATATRAWRSGCGGSQLLFFSSSFLLSARHKTVSRGSRELSFPVSCCLRWI